jgi:hypothetical protein
MTLILEKILMKFQKLMPTKMKQIIDYFEITNEQKLLLIKL